MAPAGRQECGQWPCPLCWAPTQSGTRGELVAARYGGLGAGRTWAAGAALQQDGQEGGRGAQDADSHVQRTESCSEVVISRHGTALPPRPWHPRAPSLALCPQPPAPVTPVPSTRAGLLGAVHGEGQPLLAQGTLQQLVAMGGRVGVPGVLRDLAVRHLLVQPARAQCLRPCPLLLLRAHRLLHADLVHGELSWGTVGLGPGARLGVVTGHRPGQGWGQRWDRRGASTGVMGLAWGRWGGFGVRGSMGQAWGRAAARGKGAVGLWGCPGAEPPPWGQQGSASSQTTVPLSPWGHAVGGHGTATPGARYRRALLRRAPPAWTLPGPLTILASGGCKRQRGRVSRVGRGPPGCPGVPSVPAPVSLLPPHPSVPALLTGAAPAEPLQGLS